MYKLDLENEEESDIKLPTSAGSWKKQENFKKKTSTSSAMVKPVVYVNHSKLWKIQHGNIRPPYLSPEKPVIQVKKQQLEPDKEQKTGSKLGNE